MSERLQESAQIIRRISLRMYKKEPHDKVWFLKKRIIQQQLCVSSLLFHVLICLEFVYVDELILV